MTIDNQCSDIELTSPVYFTKDITCHIPFPQQVNPKSITKVKFATNVDRNAFGGVLLYRLQRKENPPTNTHLLVIWGYRPPISYSYALYSHAWLIEHESALVWDKDKLKMLYDKYDDHWYTKSDLGLWFLNNNTDLRTDYKASCGGYRMEMTISENKNMLYPMKPLWVDPSR
jgi:hypothetical protein